MKLRSLFAGLGACVMLTMSAMANSTIITIDNTDVTGFTSSGLWTSTFVNGYYGINYSADTVNSTGDFANWNPSDNIDWLAGLWQVEMIWTAYNSRANNAAVTINTGTSTTSLFVNQKLNGGTWNDLGTYNFAATGASITLDDSNSSTGQYFIADAVRFTLVSAAQASPVSAPGTSLILLMGLASVLLSRRKFF